MLFLLDGDSDVKRVSVAVKSIFVGDRVLVGKDEDRWCCEFRDKGANDDLHSGGGFDHSDLV